MTYKKKLNISATEPGLEFEPKSYESDFVNVVVKLVDLHPKCQIWYTEPEPNMVLDT